MKVMTVDTVKELIKEYQSKDIINYNSRVDMEYLPMLMEVCDSKDGRDVISLLVRALWFYSAGGYITDNEYTDKSKMEILRLLRLTEDKIAYLEKITSAYNDGFLQRLKVACGEKIAYRKDVSLMKVKEMWKEGFTYTQIAERLDISRATVAKRIKELKRLEELEKREEKKAVRSKQQ
jgi:hypothetical protein